MSIRPKIIFLYTFIASVTLCALIGIGVLLFGNFGDVEIRVLFTTLTVTVTSILGLACGACLEANRARALPIAGISLSIVSAVMCFLIIWDVLDDSEVFIKSFLTSTLIAASCSHLSLLSLARLDARFRWSRIAAHLFVWLLAAILLYLMWFEPKGDGELVYRVIGILSILIATVTVITPVFHKLSTSYDSVARIDSEIEQLREKIKELEARKANIEASVEAVAN